MEDKLIPVEVKKRHSLRRFIRNRFTLAVVSALNSGFEKLSDEDIKMVASIMNTALINYNEKTGNPLTQEDLKKIQKRFNDLEVFTYEGLSKSYKKDIEQKEKQLGHKIKGINSKGFLFHPTSVLMLRKDEWERFKRGENVDGYTKIIAHEGFHFLINTKNNSMQRIGEQLPSEGSAESFTVKSFGDDNFSKVENEDRNFGLIHYNFNSHSTYSLYVSIINMLGIMLEVNPEVSALKNDGEFVNALKQKYGEVFYKTLIRNTNKIMDVDAYNRLENPLRLYREIHEHVVYTITAEIINRVETIEEAKKELAKLQKAERWSLRVLKEDRDRETNVFLDYRKDNTFEEYYRLAYIKLTAKLNANEGQNYEELKQCEYKQTQFNVPVREDIENTANGRNKFNKRVTDTITFYQRYYDKYDPTEYMVQGQLGVYNKLTQTDYFRQFKRDSSEYKSLKKPHKKKDIDGLTPYEL